MPNLDQYHPQPCANCDHRHKHGEVSGCIAVTSENGARVTWCDCDTYVNPRDRKADRAAGQAAGESGGDAALHSYAMNDGEWRAKAEERMEVLIARGTDFTAEDVTDTVGVAPSPNAIGGLFGAHKSRMTPVGFTTASRKEAHGRALRIWKGKADA